MQDGYIQKRRYQQPHNQLSQTDATYLCINMNHSGKKESKSLSTTSSRDSDHVSSFECHGPTLTLNRRRFVEATLHDLAQDVLRHGGFFEGQARLGNTGSNNHNLLGRTPSVSLLIRPLGDIRVLDVKVLLKGNELGLAKVNIRKSGA